MKGGREEGGGMQREGGGGREADREEYREAQRQRDKERRNGWQVPPTNEFSLQSDV